MLTKDANGNLEVERHDSTAKHFAWGAALIGAAVAVVVPPVGIAMIAGAAGAGGIVGHFWNDIPKEKVQAMSQLLQDGQSGLVFVAVNRKGEDITPLVANAQEKIVVDTIEGDLEAAFNEALKKEAASAKKAVA